MKEAQWSFNPYHQRLDEAMTRFADESPEVDTEFASWEVFQLQRRGHAFEHVEHRHFVSPSVGMNRGSVAEVVRDDPAVLRELVHHRLV